LPQPKNRSSVFMVMAVRQGIEIRYSNDGPWITFHAGDSCINYNLRDLAAGLFVASNGSQKRVLQRWLRARVTEGNGRTPAPAALQVRRGDDNG
jgi:hypothetical protein